MPIIPPDNPGRMTGTARIGDDTTRHLIAAHRHGPTPILRHRPILRHCKQSEAIQSAVAQTAFGHCCPVAAIPATATPSPFPVRIQRIGHGPDQTGALLPERAIGRDMVDRLKVGSDPDGKAAIGVELGIFSVEIIVGTVYLFHRMTAHCKTAMEMGMLSPELPSHLQQNGKPKSPQALDRVNSMP
ncbi:hypothetical protein [Novosphingobium sp.]|uniref:hypothetical protein n=1 Tax=Novosphingobium sp. TaxID=1874826 RepID=UPI001D1E00B4|nr:hypothetical protein [Novosphingobium sp.]MBX9663446.1 hypothetical protein [Novosphingobium sp.]